MNETCSTANTTNRSDATQIAPRALDGQRILLVEDSPDQQRLFAMFLWREGADVMLECYGQSAVQTVEKSQHAFDAVVMDLRLPGIDGIQATQQLREGGFNGAIVAVTAHGSEDTRQLWFRAGCDAFLEKPLDDQALINVIRQHSRQRSAEARAQ